MGIDEVGRGPLAVCVLVLPRNFSTGGGFLPVRQAGVSGEKFGKDKPKIKLKDSKKLSASQREEWFKYIKNCRRIFYAVSKVYPKTIDRINISGAANLAAKRAFEKILKVYKINARQCRIFLDGGLYLPAKYGGKTVIKGDEKITAIKMASIVAKVNRDNLLKNYSRKYEKYYFDLHKGYGTTKHIKALKKYGLTKIHRLTFLKNYPKIILNRNKLT